MQKLRTVRTGVAIVIFHALSIAVMSFIIIIVLALTHVRLVRFVVRPLETACKRTKVFDVSDRNNTRIGFIVINRTIVYTLRRRIIRLGVADNAFLLEPRARSPRRRRRRDVNKHMDERWKIILLLLYVRGTAIVYYKRTRDADEVTVARRPHDYGDCRRVGRAGVRGVGRVSSSPSTTTTTTTRSTIMTSIII